MEPLPLTTLAILLLTAWVTWRAFTLPGLFERLKFRPDRVLRAKEYDRLLSSALLHVDWVHFFCNALTLVAFGEGIEKHPDYGAGILVLIYVGSILGGNLLALAIHRNHDYAAVGASGGVCGVLFAAIFLNPGMQVSLFLLPIYVPGWVYAVLFLGYSFSGMYRNTDNIGHDAHLGGALVGLGIATALYPDVVFQSPWMFGSVIILTTAFFVFLARSPHSSLRSLFAGGLHLSRPKRRAPPPPVVETRMSVKGRLDELLDKVARVGINRLTPAERKELERLSKQLGR